MALWFIHSHSSRSVADVKETIKSCAKKLQEFDLIIIVRYVLAVQKLAKRI